jgi:hypothetical protein
LIEHIEEQTIVLFRKKNNNIMANSEDKRNSPFNSFLIDDPTPNNNRITITNEESSTICVSCQQDLRLCSSKILACLHSVCIQCLDKLKDSTGKLLFISSGGNHYFHF